MENNRREPRCSAGPQRGEMFSKGVEHDNMQVGFSGDCCREFINDPKPCLGSPLLAMGW